MLDQKWEDEVNFRIKKGPSGVNSALQNSEAVLTNTLILPQVGKGHVGTHWHLRTSGLIR